MAHQGLAACVDVAVRVDPQLSGVAGFAFLAGPEWVCPTAGVRSNRRALPRPAGAGS